MGNCIMVYFPRTSPINTRKVSEEIIETVENVSTEAINVYKDMEEIYGLYLLYDQEGMEAVMEEITLESDNPDEHAKLQGVTAKYKNTLLNMVKLLI